MRRLATGLVAAAWLGLLLLLADAAGAGELSETIGRVKPAIVGVGTWQATRRPPADLRGTGFAIGDGLHIATNLHVLPESLDDAGREQLVVFVGVGPEVAVRPARRVARDEEHDLAVLRIDGPPLPALSLMRGGDAVEGQEIAFTGFPIGAVLGLYPATHRGIVAALTPIAIPAGSPGELDAAQIKRLREPYLVYQLDATAFPGNSGSPLYDTGSGEVLGIVSSVFVKGSKERVLSDPSGITYAIPARYLRALMDDLGL